MKMSNIRQSLALLAITTISACSSAPGPTAQQTEFSEIGSPQQTHTATPFTPNSSVAHRDESNFAVNDDARIEYLRIKHHQVECEGFQVSLCLLAQKEGSDEWVYIYDQIDGFAYSWGTEYEILVIVESIEAGPADRSNQRLSLLEVITSNVPEANEAFDYLSRVTHERIVQEAPGLFRLLGEKTFTCINESCDALTSAIEQNQSALLTFQHASSDAGSLVLSAVLCAADPLSFNNACL